MDQKKQTPLLCLACLFLLQTCCFSFATSISSTSTMNHINNSTDEVALLAFKSNVTWDPNNTLSNSWTRNTSFCNWVGVSCSHRRQRVTKLDLHGMGLQGTISPYIANLSFLAYLTLSYNSFNGYLPHELGGLRRLKAISLYANKLEGTIPPSLANLSELYHLNLGNNNLRGNIPSDLGRLFNLQVLSFFNNNLSGEIPPTIFNISSLVLLNFSYNDFSGQLPTDTGCCLPNLKALGINSNQMSGKIPISLSNATKLIGLLLGINSFHGSIPDTLGNLLYLENLDMRRNNLTGTIQSSIFNLSDLTYLNLRGNQFTGPLPSDIGNCLPNIQELILWGNRFSGQIPLSLGNMSKLSLLAIGYNDFSGPVPPTLGKLPLIKWLGLHDNRLTNEPGAKDLNFLTYFTSCQHLKFLALSYNPLRGIIPSSMGNFSVLEEIHLQECQIEGTIPMELGNLSTLITLDLGGNNLRGTIPSTIGMLEKLQRLYLYGNILQGSIPFELTNLQNLGELYLYDNMLSRDIPDLFQNLSALQIISLSNNLLSKIPLSLWTLQNLRGLNLSHNSLGGVLPEELGNLKNLVIVDFSINQYTGTIPNSWGHLQMLTSLDLRLNSLEGHIPVSFDQLLSIEFLDLSSNHLNGTIPKSLEKLHYLEVLNLSFNSLDGEIPNGGVFANITAQSFIGNFKLCSPPKLHIKLNVSICPPQATESRDASSPVLKIIISLVVVTTFVVCFSLLIIYRGKKKKTPSPIENSLIARAHKMISYQELLHATSNFSEGNLIGVGSFGSVYKGIMVDGSLVAVKVLNIQLEGAWQSFDTECEVMRNVRHRNLVKIITSCSNLDFRALVLQFMPNGSLDQWMHSSYNNYLSLAQRIGILIDVASAMEYLHHHYSRSIVHCDLKPSNVLLDEDMVAHVSDFGIAKLLDVTKSATRTNTLGTIGYVSPEYGLVGKVSTKGDVYSYGILLLEMLTRKKPIDSMFIGGLSLRQWVNSAFPNAIMDVVDINLKTDRGNNGSNTEEIVVVPHGRRLSCLSSIVEVGLLCSKELAEERISMKEVVVRLMKIKKDFL